MCLLLCVFSTAPLAPCLHERNDSIIQNPVLRIVRAQRLAKRPQSLAILRPPQYRAGMIAMRSNFGFAFHLALALPRHVRVMDRRAAPLVALMLALMGATVPAAAQDWPLRPVTMAVSFAAGGGADVRGRIL